MGASHGAASLSSAWHSMMTVPPGPRHGGPRPRSGRQAAAGGNVTAHGVSLAVTQAQPRRRYHSKLSRRGAPAAKDWQTASSLSPAAAGPPPPLPGGGDVAKLRRQHGGCSGAPAARAQAASDTQADLDS